MIIEVSARRSGRTTRAVAWMKSSDLHHLVVLNEAQKKWIQRHYGFDEDEKKRIHTYNDYDHGFRSRNLGDKAEFFIEDLEIYLSRSSVYKLGGFNIATD